MFGFSNLPKISAVVPQRASTRTALAIAAAGAALFAVANTAHAQDCVGGYRMLKGEIPVICQEAGARAMYSAGQPASSQPTYTGSINTGSSEEQPANAARPSDSPTAASESNEAATCDHGYRSVATPNNGATLMMKCS